MRVRMGKWARRGAIAAGAVAIVYLLLANGALATGLVARGLSQDPQLLQVTYASAYSLWPGHLQIEKLDLKMEDDSIQLQLRIEAADVRLALTPLPLGVRVRGGAVELIPFIGTGWLEAELQRLGIGAASPVR